MKKVAWLAILTALVLLSGSETYARAETGRQDGERFEGVVGIEGMEETVLLEHAVNDALGIGIDFDCERFLRQSGPDEECFVSIWDDPTAPCNTLEIHRSGEDAEAVAASAIEDWSRDCDSIGKETCRLGKAGDCTRIEASCADGLRTAYILPAEEGCLLAVAHCTFESAEGFGVRIRRMMDTLERLDGREE